MATVVSYSFGFTSLLMYKFEKKIPYSSEAIQANLNLNKRILIPQPFFHWVHADLQFKKRYHVILKPLANGRNILGQRLPKLLDLKWLLRPLAHLASCYCSKVGVVASVCTPMPTRTQQLSHSRANNVGSCCVLLHVAWVTKDPDPRFIANLHTVGFWLNKTPFFQDAER